MVALLLAAGASPRSAMDSQTAAPATGSGRSGSTALSAAARRGHADVVAQLLLAAAAAQDGSSAAGGKEACAALANLASADGMAPLFAAAHQVFEARVARPCLKRMKV